MSERTEQELVEYLQVLDQDIKEAEAWLVLLKALREVTERDLERDFRIKHF